MVSKFMCPHYMPCGLCTYYNKPCDEIVDKPTTDLNSTVYYQPNPSINTSTSKSDSPKLTFTSNVMEPKKAVIKCRHWKYQAPGERYCSGQKNSPRCYCGGDQSKCEVRLFTEKE